MGGPFDSFVIFADMRTGSNLLEESLNACPGLCCHGEVFNPLFIGHDGQEQLFGLSLEDRDRDPAEMIHRLAQRTDGIGGFRLFPGHDPRVLDHCLADPRCAKIVLARNPVDSYVSVKIARRTGQWWLGDHSRAKTATVRFETAEFEDFLRRLQAFYGQIRRALQTSGQTAFHIHYDDLADPAVMAGLVRWLGATVPAKSKPAAARVQNPEPLEAKVENFTEMEEALGRADAFDLYRIPDFEPRRGPNVPGWLASDRLGLLYMPIAGGPTSRISAWLEAAGGAPPVSGWTQKSLRGWLRGTPGHRSFTIVSHPLVRAHDAFCTKILDPGPDSFLEIRNVLVRRYGLDLPEGGAGSSYGADRHRAAFLGFLRFLKGNLSGQTSVRVPAVWASQGGLVRALAEVVVPDLILRAEMLETETARLGPTLPAPPPDAPPYAPTLDAIYDGELEDAARAAYARDYLTFGFGPWG